MSLPPCRSCFLSSYAHAWVEAAQGLGQIKAAEEEREEFEHSYTRHMEQKWFNWFDDGVPAP